MTPRYRIEVFPSSGASFYWRIRSRNGQILATSEAYTSRRHARRTADRFSIYSGLKVAEVGK